MPPIPAPSRMQRRQQYEEFIEQIRQMCQSPGTRKALRELRGRPIDECEDTPGELRRLTYGIAARRAHFTVASLVALTDPRTDRDDADADEPPGSRPDVDEPAATGATWARRPNLGTTLARAVTHCGWNEDSTTKHLRLLTRVSDDQLHRRLPRLVARLNSDGLSVDFPVLLDDLARRHFDRARVGTDWKDQYHLHLPATPYRLEDPE